MKRYLTAAVALILPLHGISADQNTDPWKARARDILSEIVSMRTAQGHGQVPGMAAYLADQLYEAGFARDDVEIERYGETATLIARYRSETLSMRRPLLLLAHMDVVEADPADWELDPFSLTEKEGFFFGRGVYDNKFGIAMLVTSFLRLRAEGFRPDRDLILVFSGDEETSQATTAALANKRELRAAEYALNSDSGGGRLGADGEALAYFLQAAEKTYASFDVTLRNPGGHSSEPRADNAIYALAGALKNIEAHRFPVRVNEITQGFMSAMGELEPGETGDALRRLAVNPEDEAAAAVLAQRPKYVGLTRTTCVATKLSAGHAENALPQRASATINCRIFPGVNPEDVRGDLQGLAGDGAEVTIVDKAFLGSASPLREDVLAAVVHALERSAGSVPAIPEMSAGYTDGSFFRVAGVPTYGVGSVFIKPEDSFAHGLNERVPVAALAAGLEHWRVLLTELAR